MFVLRKINNNCVLARDSSGADVIAFGKGLGFHSVPYELNDLARVERTFYGMDSSSIRALQDIPSDVLELASDIIDDAQDALGVDLNPNAAVTLADHISFAIRRTKDGIVIESPLAFDVQRFYPREYRLGRRAVTLVRSRLGVELPEAERTNIALHVINSESERPDMARTKQAAEVIAEVVAVVERELGVSLDKESFAYNRFVTHVRFLVDRLLSGGAAGSIDGAVAAAGEAAGTADAPMLASMGESYPIEARCAHSVVEGLRSRWGWECADSEELYLLLHIHQLRSRLG